MLLVGKIFDIILLTLQNKMHISRKKEEKVKKKDNHMSDNEILKSSSELKEDVNFTNDNISEEGDNEHASLPSASHEEELEAIVADLTVKLAEKEDKYLRLSAEFDNFRRRTLKEKMELVKTASENVMTSILSVIDDFERAMIAIEGSTDLEATKEGLRLIYGKFNDFIKQNGVTEIKAMGIELNTDQHEAITKIPAPSDELKGKIVDVVQKGYLLNDKVIRFAKVVIGA